MTTPETICKLCFLNKTHYSEALALERIKEIVEATKNRKPYEYINYYPVPSEWRLEIPDWVFYSFPTPVIAEIKMAFTERKDEIFYLYIIKWRG